MSRDLKRKSQSLIEYALILGIVAAALLGMQVYMKRGIQRAVQLSADQLGEQQVTINSQREANTISTSTDKKFGTVRTQESLGGGQASNINTTDITSGTTTSEVISYSYNKEQE